MTTKRKLTKNEINKALQWLTPKIFNPQFPEVSKDLANGWKRILYYQMAEEKFNPEKLDEITETIKESFLKKMIPSGTPVGKITGTSIGEKSTQFTLKLKSNASTSSSGTSISVTTIFKSLVDAPKNPSHQQIEIRFHKNFKFAELYTRRKEFQRLHLDADDFIISIDVVYSEDNISDWYEIFEEVYGYGVSDITSNLCLHVKLDVQKLYDYRLTLAEIANKLRDSSPHLQVFFSPQDLGVIDIYLHESYVNNSDFVQKMKLIEGVHGITADDGWELDEEEDITEEEISYSTSRSRSRAKELREGKIIENLEPMEMTDVDKEELYLETIVSPMLSANNYGGSERVEEVFVAWTPYAATIKRMQKRDTDYLLEFNPKVLNHTGIKEDDVLDWFEKMQWEITPGKESIYYLSKDNINSSKSPSEELTEALNNIDTFDDVVKVFLEATGGFHELIVHPDVDTDHSYTDSAQIMKNIFGIEVARRVMSNLFGEILSGDHYVSPVHPELIVSFMTFSGEVVPLNRFSFGRRHVGAIERALFEEQLPALTMGATFPVVESARTPATSTVFGSAPPIGTGSVSIYEPEAYTNIRKQREFEEGASKEYERQKLLRAIEEIESSDVSEWPELAAFDVPEFEPPELETYSPRILRPSEISEDIPEPIEFAQVIPADSALSSTIEVEVAAPTKPVVKPVLRIKRGIRMK